MNVRLNKKKISEETLFIAVNELLNALKVIEQKDFDVDTFGEMSRRAFDFEEKTYQETSMYRLLSLMLIALVDLGLIELE